MLNSDVILSMTNSTSENALVAVEAATGAVIAKVPTGGKGGVSGNAGAVQTYLDFVIAVPNYGSGTVSIFLVLGTDFKLINTISTVDPPVSISFSVDHMYVATTKSIKSFTISTVITGKNAYPDGIVPLSLDDGSIAQVIYIEKGLDSHLLYSEKNDNGVVSMVDLSPAGAVMGASIPIPLPAGPAGGMTPFGMVSLWGGAAAVAFAHSDLEALVVDGSIVASTNGPLPVTGNAPCWNARYGMNIFAANTPAGEIDLFTFTPSGTISFNGVAAAGLSGPTDLCVAPDGVLAVVTREGISWFQSDINGNLTFINSLKMAAMNGVAIIR